jgi:hypothetical protein
MKVAEHAGPGHGGIADRLKVDTENSSDPRELRDPHLLDVDQDQTVHVPVYAYVYETSAVTDRH